jgi:hypothetical protein
LNSISGITNTERPASPFTAGANSVEANEAIHAPAGLTAKMANTSPFHGKGLQRRFCFFCIVFPSLYDCYDEILSSQIILTGKEMLRFFKN